MKSSDAVNAKFGELLADAQEAMDVIRQQQRKTGGFTPEAHVAVAARVGMTTGFHQALLAMGVTMIPEDFVVRMNRLSEDARALRYGDEQPSS